MSLRDSPPLVDANEDVSALIARLHETGNRLEALTAGEVDTVADREGRTFVLRHAQEQLRNVEVVKQAAILNALPAHIALLDINGVIISVNEAWRRFADANALPAPGYGIGLNYVEICDRAQGMGSFDGHQAANGIRSVLSAALPSFSLEYTCHSPAEQRWFLLTVTPLTSGRPGGVVVMHVNMTAKRQAEESLRAGELRFRAMIESITDVIALTGMDGTLNYVSPSVKEVAGYETAELVGCNLIGLLHPDDRARGIAAVAEISRSPGVPIHAELRYLHKNGSWLSLESTSRNMAHVPEIGGMVVTLRNMTERNLATQALRESEEKFRQLADNVTDVFYMTSADLRQMLYVSPAYEQIWGRSVQSLYANPAQWGEAILPEERARVIAAFSSISADKPSASIEFRISRPDGAVRWIQSRGFLVCDAAGKVIRLAGIASDITERKRVAAELEQTHQELLEASRRDGMAEVATSILHNVGNVLNSVNVSASLVADDVRNSRAADLTRVAAMLHEHAADLGSYLTSDPQGRHVPAFLQQIAQEWVGHQQTVVKELDLLRSNIDHIREIVAMQQSHGKVVGSAEIVNVKDLVEDSLRLNEGALRERHVIILREYEEAPPISVEKHKVLQILVNLIRNAKHACDRLDDGTGQISVQVAKAGDRIRVSVSDNGVGIPAENLTRIFSHGFTTRKDGHGFGLHSSALSAQEIGGSLNVFSQGPGSGATFTLELPLAPPPRPVS